MSDILLIFHLFFRDRLLLLLDSEIANESRLVSSDPDRVEDEEAKRKESTSNTSSPALICASLEAKGKENSEERYAKEQEEIRQVATASSASLSPEEPAVAQEQSTVHAGDHSNDLPYFLDSHHANGVTMCLRKGNVAVFLPAPSNPSATVEDFRAKAIRELELMHQALLSGGSIVNGSSDRYVDSMLRSMWM